MSVDTMYETLIAYGIATEEAVNLVVNINGYSKETMEDILYVTTGYRDFKDVI